MANHSLLDRESQPILTLQVCAQPILPLAPILQDAINLGSHNQKRQTKLQDAPRIAPVTASPTTVLKFTPVISEVPFRSTTKSTTRTTLPFIPSKPDRVGGAPSSGIPIVRKFRHQMKTETLKSTVVESTPSSRFEPENRSIPRDNAKLPVMETLPFGTRTAPRKIIRQGKTEQNFEILEAVAIDHAVSEMKKSFHPMEPTTLPPHLQENLGSRRMRSKRKASRKFNSRRHGQPKSLIPIKLLEQENSAIVSDKLPVTRSNTSCSTIQLTLLDANDNNPKFLPTNQYHFTVRQDALPGMRIGRVSTFLY